MAIVVDELEVVPAPEPGGEGGAPAPAAAAAPPSPAAHEEIERALRRRAERSARLGAW